MNMKFCPDIDCTWYNFHVDISRVDVVSDGLRWRNLYSVQTQDHSITNSAFISTQCGYSGYDRRANYVIVKRHVRRHLLRYQRENSTTYSQPLWQQLAKIPCSSHVRWLSTDVHNLRYRFGVGTLRFPPYVESDPTGVSTRRVWIGLSW